VALALAEMIPPQGNAASPANSETRFACRGETRTGAQATLPKKNTRADGAGGRRGRSGVDTDLESPDRGLDPRFLATTSYLRIFAALIFQESSTTSATKTSNPTIIHIHPEVYSFSRSVDTRSSSASVFSFRVDSVGTSSSSATGDCSSSDEASDTNLARSISKASFRL